MLDSEIIEKAKTQSEVTLSMVCRLIVVRDQCIEDLKVISELLTILSEREKQANEGK